MIAEPSPRDRDPLGHRRGDRRRRRSLGRDGCRCRGERAAARPHRGSARRVHRAGRHGDLEQREPGRAGPARRRAGRAAARGDAGRAGAAAGEVFAAVAEEVGALLRVGGRDDVPLRGRRHGDRRRGLGRAGRADPGRHPDRLEGRTRRAGARDRAGPPASTTTRDVRGRSRTFVRESGLSSAVGSPIVVEGRLWGAMVVGTRRAEPLPAGHRVAPRELHRAGRHGDLEHPGADELAASRARIVAATDEERRRVVRDLHDGAQQRLVHTVITLKLARRALEQRRRPPPRS